LRWCRRGKAVGRNAENQVRVRRKAFPDRALAGIRHAGEIAIQLEQIGDNLEMQMRRPVAIVRRRANAANLLAARYGLASMAAFERIFAQVAVEREESRAIIRRMPQDHQRTVVQSRRVVDGQEDFAGQWRIDWRAGLDKQVKTKVNRAALVNRVRA
jgi:hypothetical protein